MDLHCVRTCRGASASGRQEDLASEFLADVERMARVAPAASAASFELAKRIRHSEVERDGDHVGAGALLSAIDGRHDSVAKKDANTSAHPDRFIPPCL